MASVCFYFQVHQPFRLRRYSVFDSDANYFDDYKNAQVCRKVAGKCYLPANRVLLDLIRKYDGDFSVSFSITGTAFEQFERWSPETIDSFQALVDKTVAVYLLLAGPMLGIEAALLDQATAE